MRLGEIGRLSELGSERVAIFRELGDQAAVAHALDEAGVYEYMASDYDRAEARYAESRALGEELGDPTVAAAVLHSLAVLAQSRGDFPAAREVLLDSLGLLRAIAARRRPPVLPRPHRRAVRRRRRAPAARRGCSSRRRCSSSAA